jgi:hypothetical protein
MFKNVFYNGLGFGFKSWFQKASSMVEFLCQFQQKEEKEEVLYLF